MSKLERIEKFVSVSREVRVPLLFGSTHTHSAQGKQRAHLLVLRVPVYANPLLMLARSLHRAKI